MSLIHPLMSVNNAFTHKHIFQSADQTGEVVFTAEPSHVGITGLVPPPEYRSIGVQYEDESEPSKPKRVESILVQVVYNNSGLGHIKNSKKSAVRF
jgi:hypothetical protein